MNKSTCLSLIICANIHEYSFASANTYEWLFM